MRKLIESILFWGGFAVGAGVAWRRFESVLGWVAGRMSSAETPPALTNSQIATPVVKTYIAGATLDDALSAVKTLTGQGYSVSLHQLGEQLKFSHDAVAQRDGLIELIEQLIETGLTSSVSVKLSQLGVDLNPSLAYASLEAIAEAASANQVPLLLESESAATLDRTLEAFGQLRPKFPVGLALQTYLYRSADDLANALDNGCTIRLSYGSYPETADTSFPGKEARDVNFVRLAEMALSAETSGDLFIEAHDDALVQQMLDFVKANDIPKSRFAFEMVYGRRDDLQAHLASLGYRVQVYVPFGTAWYPYVMRRMVEQPKDMQMFLGGLA